MLGTLEVGIKALRCACFRKSQRTMKGGLQALSLAALLLNICLSTFALPIASEDDGADPILLLATGLLSQEKRLQAMEQRLNEMSIQGAALSTTRSEVVRARLQQSLEERQQLPIETRMTYLEEDVEDNGKNTDHKLQVVHDMATDGRRQESEDVLELHKMISDSVTRLESEINVTFARIEGDLDLVKAGVEENKADINTNLHWYFHLNTGLHRTIDYVRYIEYTLEDRIYALEEQMKEVDDEERMGTEVPTQSSTEPSEPSMGPGIPTEPSMGGVGETGGGRAARIMNEAKKALQEWMDSTQPSRKTAAVEENAEVESARVESKTGKSQSETLRELLYELNNYNM